MFPEPFFITIFVIVFIITIISSIAGILRFFRLGPKNTEQTTEYQPPIVREREIVREIVKIRCLYCGNTYDEKEDVCPHCGGRRTPAPSTRATA